MRIREIIQEITRRGFLGATAGASMGTTAPTAKAFILPDDPNDPKVEVRTQADRQHLQNICNKILRQLMIAAGPDINKLGGISLNIINTPRVAYVQLKTNLIMLDFETFHHAPINVLVFVIGHELGHLALGHLGHQTPQFGTSQVGTGKVPTRMVTHTSSRQDEQDADDYSVRLCQKLGHNKSITIQWLNQNMETYKKEMNTTPAASADHPTWGQRAVKAKEKGFNLSKANAAIEYFDELKSVLA